jgi:catechol 2,3-dioxygenase-like lactoylglutathione lyase family enzyme
MRSLLTAALVLALAGPARAQLAPPNHAGVSFGFVHLKVKDVDLQKKVWVEHFGGVAVQKGPLTVVKFQNMMVVLARPEPTSSNEGSVIDHFGFHVRDITSVLQAWRAAGYDVIREFTGPEGTKNAFLRGPDGLLKFEVQDNKTISALAIPNHVHFLTPDNESLLKWYVDRFGLAPRARGTISTTADAPNFNVSFSKSPMPLAGTKGRSVDHIGFEVRNLEAFVKKLEASGVKFDVAPRRNAAIELTFAFFTDPSGVFVELTEGIDKY